MSKSEGISSEERNKPLKRPLLADPNQSGTDGCSTVHA